MMYKRQHLLLSTQQATHNNFMKLQHTDVNAYPSLFILPINYTSKLWNSLPESVTQARDVEEFKKLIGSY